MPFPDPCGIAFERAVNGGADPSTIVPDDYFVVHGGTGLIPPLGTEFSASVGPTLEDAAAAVPYGQIRVAAVGVIRSRGGSVKWIPELTRYRIVNLQHVNIAEAGATAFSAIQTNPVLRRDRIGGKP